MFSCKLSNYITLIYKIKVNRVFVNIMSDAFIAIPVIHFENSLHDTGEQFV